METGLVEIKNLIYEIRGQKVMLDSDLAKLYEVETKMLNRAVKRNIERFPSNFMFQLNEDEWKILRFQFGTSKLILNQEAADNIFPMFLPNKVLQCFQAF